MVQADTLNEVRIPDDGWYAFFWGDETIGAPTTTSHPSNSAKDAVRLVVHHNLTTQKINLPLVAEAGDAISSLYFGAAIFLMGGSRMHVELSSCGSAEWRIKPIQYDHSNDSSCPPQHCHVNRRRLVCRTCGKSFRDVKSIRQHCRDVHHVHAGDTSLDPMWTTPLTILYQDDFIACIVKPQNMAVMGARQSLSRSNLLLPLKSTATSAPSWPTGPPDRIFGKPRVTHRLDAGTGGVLVVAKTIRAEVAMKQAFCERLCRKTYVALCHGRIKDSKGTITEPVSGKQSPTDYQVLEYVPSRTSGWLTAVQLHPVSGRHHQIRRHLKHVGHPIYGDRRYGPPVENHDGVQSRLCLWALEISFPHPFMGEWTTCSMNYPPDWLRYVLDRERKSAEPDADGREGGREA